MTMLDHLSQPFSIAKQLIITFWTNISIQQKNICCLCENGCSHNLAPSCRPIQDSINGSLCVLNWWTVSRWAFGPRLLSNSFVWPSICGNTPCRLRNGNLIKSFSERKLQVKCLYTLISCLNFLWFYIAMEFFLCYNFFSISSTVLFRCQNLNVRSAV